MTRALMFNSHRLRRRKYNTWVAGRATLLVYASTSLALLLRSNMPRLQLIHKMRAGQKPLEAVEDIIRQGVSELRKCAFGEDVDDVRSLSWTREQAWVLLRALASRDTVPYYETLMNAPFKGDEAPLRSLERAELITVEAQDGRPSTIRPGRPVYSHVFRRLVNGMCTPRSPLFPIA
jgi:hypothetical protein